VVGTEQGPRQGRGERVRAPARPASASVPTARARFRDLDPYRVEREWKRYEGTAQRDLFRQLRVRFLLRHATRTGIAVEIGPGPGRFTPQVGRRGARRVALDISDGMLRALRGRWDAASHGETPDLVRADAVHPPVRPGACREVVALGNPIGFAGGEAHRLLAEAVGLLAPGGTILLETVCGPGERSRYAARLPPTAVGRLFRSPVPLLRTRIEREGFELEPDRDPGRHGFRPVPLAEIDRAFRPAGVKVVEAMAVAPVLGFEPERAEAVELDPAAWANLLAVEEEVGRQPVHCRVAASLLVAGHRGP
jgi:SAM-dependent methyltransferase